MKRFLFLIPLLFIFSACDVFKEYDDYEQIDDTYYFPDFETMAAVIVPKINKSFKDWHYSKREFEKKYDKYLNNIDKNQECYEYLQHSRYKYAVKNNTSNNTVKTRENFLIKDEYYWITEDNGDAVVFFMN